jgi:hypothetical protein
MPVISAVIGGIKATNLKERGQTPFSNYKSHVFFVMDSGLYNVYEKFRFGASPQKS